MGVGFGLTLATALTLGQLLGSREDAGVTPLGNYPSFADATLYAGIAS